MSKAEGPQHKADDPFTPPPFTFANRPVVRFRDIPSYSVGYGFFTPLVGFIGSVALLLAPSTTAIWVRLLGVPLMAVSVILFGSFMLQFAYEVDDLPWERNARTRAARKLLLRAFPVFSNVLFVVGLVLIALKIFDVL